MLPIFDKPVIHYVVEEAVKSGLDEILIIVGQGKDAIINYFDYNTLDGSLDKYGIRSFPDIYFVRQKRLLGLGDSLRYAEKFVGGDPFVLLLGDTIYRSHTNKTVTSQLIDSYYKIKHPIIAVERVKKEKIPDYGIISGKSIGKNVWRIDSLVEKPSTKDAPSDLGVVGIYVLEEEIFTYVKKIKAGKNGEFQLTDALNLFCKDNELFATTFKGDRFDIGTKDLWIEAFIEFLKVNGRYKLLEEIKK
jgi:UTP--glucose-1-phosphate uridylyltransferase